MDSELTSLGICVGASSLKVVELRHALSGATVGRTGLVSHGCDIREALRRVLRDYPPLAYDYVAATGRKLHDVVSLPAVTEPEATEEAVRLLFPRRPIPFRAVLSLGSENFVLYELDEDASIVDVRTGSKCASGTGEFFLQQIRRMSLGIDEASRLAQGAEPYRVSGRCSVFCKSDCTHALNKGVPKARVCAGLGDMLAEKALELLGSLAKRNLLVVGGVTRNAYVVRRLREQVENLVVPEYAEVFEALGAAACALGRKLSARGPAELAPAGKSFSTLPPLAAAAHLVTFREGDRASARQGDETILGLDVGSTTTKAALVRAADDRVLASVYLRTNGDPVGASRQCYRAIGEALGAVRVSIVALGVTGSGRHIAALHAGTPAIVNEIIAHAAAAAFYDPEVDTILEIGGQDAKYTYLVNGVPCDYAMNEACSAGTGSFLEEAAKESLHVEVADIQQMALGAARPPNFNDQCAAFIASDIKNAGLEMGREEILAGLVYSVCMNYNNRVRGPRKIGRKVFMQGGVCYNRAVPVAMAALLNAPIIVPPEPGLTGAFGAALEVKRRMRLGLLERSQFSLDDLAAREVHYGDSFTCPGARERCDRACTINVIRLDGRSMPFGGACNKYYNAVRKVRLDPAPLDFVKRRQELLFAERPEPPAGSAATIGLTRSFLTNLLYPLYERFFRGLGFSVVLPDAPDPEGMKRPFSSFCYPVQIAHGMMAALLAKRPDYVFLPRVSELHVENYAKAEPGHRSTCVTLQAEPFYLRSAFRELEGRLLSPVLDFSKGWRSAEGTFVELGRALGCGPERARRAFRDAVTRQEAFFQARSQLGREALQWLLDDPARIGVVLFGRPYNAFADEANLGIPRKFASRGVACIPFDCLPFQAEPADESLTWAIALDILRAARLVKKHPTLFGAYVTNFSCGPDSFVVGYFRDIMQTKPSLTLEIDSHTADVGITTRVEAFLDIIERYRKLGIADPPRAPFRKPAVVGHNGHCRVVAGDGSVRKLTDPAVKVVFPSMGRTVSELAGAVFRGFGIRAEAVPLPTPATLALGKANACCKECLPLLLSAGSMVEYVQQHRRNGEMTLYFMPTSNGSCRFSQYCVFLDRLIEKRRVENLATFNLTSENSYGGFGGLRALRLVRAIVIADAMDDIKNALEALALDRAQAAALFNAQWERILDSAAHGGKGLTRVLGEAARHLAGVPLRCPPDQAARVLMAGEIFVRKDEFSSQRVVEALARKGIVVARAPMLEWIRYVDYWVQHVEKRRLPLGERIELEIRTWTSRAVERQVKRVLARSGLCQPELCDLGPILDAGEHWVDREFAGGETILVVGRFFHEILREFDGMISVGPFGCMPTRIIQSILVPESKPQGNPRIGLVRRDGKLASVAKLPFLSIECDGNAFPPIIEAQLEAFALQVQRIHANGPARGLVQPPPRVDNTVR